MNLVEEVRRGYTISVEMKKVWKVQMDLLKKLLAVCEKYDLDIWADGGTLLGAVRERGYIPWDDDIDMAMLREDFDVLVRVAPKEFSHPFFFQYGYTEKYYPLAHAKIRMDHTAAIEPKVRFRHIHQGIFIDIFPYDAVPDQRDELDTLIRKRKDLYYAIHSCTSRISLRHPGRSLRIIYNRLHFKELYARFESIFRENRIADYQYISCLSFIADDRRFFRKKEWYSQTLYVPFEDMVIPIPVGFHEILTKQYGDYMVPRQTPAYHGSFWKLSAEESYKEYAGDLKLYLKEHEKKQAKINY